jgi:Asp-tRNA(Asn)/Glu-tRNA(Gln) amidotransferase A subunit family amidase
MGPFAFLLSNGPVQRMPSTFAVFLPVRVRAGALNLYEVASALRAGAVALALAWGGSVQAAPPDAAPIDRDLMEVSVDKLHGYYAEHRYTVRQVVDWYLARIARYNGVYHALEQVFAEEARATADRQDSAAAGTPHGPLWGVPIVIKANTSIAGTVTTDGWDGYTIPGHELLAPRDATIVARLRAAGAVILGHTNMPDFANADTTRSSSFGRTGNAYDVRFSPGGSSGGTVTAISANLAVLANGTDTANSIRAPAATSGLVGVLPTRGLVSIAGIAPLDWLLDNTGPIARNVGDAALALSVMAGEDPLDPVTQGSSAKAQPGPYAQYLRAGALRGKRLGVPAFILQGVNTPFHGTPAAVPELAAARQLADASMPLDPRTRAAFLKAVGELRALGATVVMDDTVLPEAFARAAARIATYPYVREGTDRFLGDFGPAQYHSGADYERVVGAPLGAPITGQEPAYAQFGDVHIFQRQIASDPDAEANVHGPRRKALALYLETMDRLHLDGYVYPALQMPPVDETAPVDPANAGTHSATGWVNMLGVPAVVVVGGFYDSGLPFGLEFSGRPFRDGELLGFGYAWEQATHHRHPPVLVDAGLLPEAR